MPVAGLALAFLVLLTLGVPIAFVIGWVAVIGIVPLGTNLIIVPQRIFGGIDNFVLLAVPLFILAADLMERSGITDDLLAAANRLIGRVNGGLGYSNVVCSTVFGSISGAAVADAASLGRILVPAMERTGYSRSFAAALTAASSLQSPIIPPSILAVVYASIMGVSVGALFLAGIVPGLLLGLSCILINAWYCRGKNLRPQPTREPQVALSFALARAGAALAMPMIIIGGIVGGVFTPTESAAVGVVYALIIGVVIRRQISFSDLVAALRTTARISSQVLLIIAASALLSWLLVIMQVPSHLARLILSLSIEPWQVLLLINLALLLVGMVLEPAAAIILFGPMLLPIIRAIGVDPVHFGIIMLVNLTIGMVTPPVGTVLYATGAVTGVPVTRLARALVPFIAAGIVVLLVVTFVSPLATALPNAFGF